jgi:M6 family metalloprotease-like protein
VLSWREAPETWAAQDIKNPGHIVAMARCVFADQIDIAAYDAGANGRIDHLFVVHSGRLAQDRTGPKALFAPGRADRSVSLQSQGIGSVGQQVPIGYYLHEAGHRYFGLRDRYGDHRHGNYGIGTWGLMGLGHWGPHAKMSADDLNRYPVHVRARAKRKLGWGTVKIVKETTKDVLLEPIETTGQVVRVPAVGSHDFFLEVRSPVGFHAKLPGHGLLVWKEPKKLNGQVELLAADGRDDLAHGNDLNKRPLPPNGENFSDASDPFPGSEGVTEVTDPITGIRIHNIRQEGVNVRFDVTLPTSPRAVVPKAP